MSRRINVFGRPIEYDVGVTYDPSTNLGTPKILEVGDDISVPTKAAVVKNTSDTSNGRNDPEHRNRFPVGDSFFQIELTDPLGYPTELDPTPNTSERTNGTGRQFIEDRGELDSIKNYSDSTVRSARTLKDPGTIAPVLKKGKKNRNVGEHDGNTLLREGVDKIQESYVSPILSNNRFTAAAQRSNNSPVRVNPNHPPDTLGSYRNFREATDGQDVHDGHFANIGALLSVRATSELASTTGYGGDGPDGIAASAASLLPGTAQIGLIKVPIDDLRPIEAFKSLLDDDTDPVNMDPDAANDHFINDSLSSSWGQMNNVLEPFSGLLPLGMIAASTALVIAMKLALKGLTVLLAAITSGKQGVTKKDSQGRYFLGHYIHSTAPSGKFPPLPIPSKFLGLTDTIHDFEDCVDKGIEAVFGGGLGNSFERVLESPGFYGVICRNIVRSAANIVIQVQNAVKGNPIQVAQNIIELVNVIRSSKVIAAINVMARIGDTILVQDDKPFQKETEAGIVRYSVVDALDDNFRVGKGRMQGRLQNALANSTSPSAFLFPREMVSALTAYSQRYAGSVTPAALSSIKSRVGLDKKPMGDIGKRIPDEIRKSVEAELDAEYVPFYFHDLRTNEITSFHAFLRTLSDDYTVESENIKAIGRIDPVKIYKSTERRIGLEFYCVATNKQDFDQMWWKINKLLTMVYPQWTKGDVLTNSQEGVSFTQPFSQMPSNSPLIRLRLGDLFRSNYSRFALARLFGLGQTDTFFGVKVEEEMITKLVDFTQAVENSNLELLNDVDIFVEPGFYQAKTSNAPSIGISLGKSKNFPSVHVMSREVGRIIPNEQAPAGSYVVQLVERNGGGDAFIIAPADQIHVDKIALNLALNKRVNLSGGTATDPATLDKINDFLAPRNNSIVRSFESSAGKGLACMIDSMGFNWLDNIPWETEAYGSRAPKMCVIRMQLTPIHDIAPGLDANGFNRAPVYNVGEIMNGINGDGWDEQGEGRAKFDDLRKKLRTVLK